MKKQTGDATFAVAGSLLMVALVVAAGGGWIANIVKLVGMNLDHVTGMLIARAVGIVIAPLGAVLGYL